MLLAMKVDGKVTTPPNLVNYMIEKLFAKRLPKSTDRVLDPGCGKGAFIDGIIMWCKRKGIDLPQIVGIEIDKELAKVCKKKYKNYNNITIIEGDFLLLDNLGEFDFVISNPPYISIEKLSLERRKIYRKLFKSATGRFDTYILFLEKSINLLKQNGRLVFVTPEKYLYTLSAKIIRKILAQYHIEEIELLNERIFRGLLAYPTITVVNKTKPSLTQVVFRDGSMVKIKLPLDGSPWLYEAYRVKYSVTMKSCKYRLRDIAVRISAGVATGRDRIFIVRVDSLPEELKPFAWPTISGEELSKFEPNKPIDYTKLQYAILLPYDKNENLLSEEEAEPLINYLSKYRKELESRRAVKVCKKKWYAFHEHPPMKSILNPKILWKDVAKEPKFWMDLKGMIIPRHNVYYLVPRNPAIIPKLLEYLNRDDVKRWIKAHAQRAANGYLRIQATLLKNLPIPEELYLKSLVHTEYSLTKL